MKLMTEQIRKALPKLGEQDGAGMDAIVHVKFFNPMGAGTWYATEFDGEDTFFGWADLGDPQMAELGYFSLSELESVRLRTGLKIERDLYFEPTPLSQLVER